MKPAFVATGLAMLALAAPVVAADLQVRDAWARATPPGAGVAAVYLTIVGGDAADRLVAAKTDRAAMTQVHAVTESDGMARMREAGLVDVPPHASVVFAPNGLHLMLMDLGAPLVAGQPFVVTLTFERSGTREVDVEVLAPGQAPPTARR
ncbi:MAG TPA: copper chaperone PCu(A)C [Steroidobacteraceae bacterium]|nr:copper chaperone PCu(A)C [Steroidobacteraceae bacterium]